MIHCHPGRELWCITRPRCRVQCLEFQESRSRNLGIPQSQDKSQIKDNRAESQVISEHPARKLVKHQQRRAGGTGAMSGPGVKIPSNHLAQTQSRISAVTMTSHGIQAWSHHRSISLQRSILIRKVFTRGRRQPVSFHLRAFLTSHRNPTENRIDDGRVDIKIDSMTRRLSRRLTATVQSQLVLEEDLPPSEEAIGLPPALNIVIQIVGSRGDVQPFVSLGLTLKKFGHRVRIATHATFRHFIEDLGLEFFCIGGDPAELMAFMVKNPGLIPSFDSVRSGEVQRRRRAVRDILRGCWRSCFEAGNGLDAEAAEPSRVFGVQRDPVASEVRKDPTPFVADAIIANPPSFAHLHCAEKLGIPLHLMFTYVYTLGRRTFSKPVNEFAGCHGRPLKHFHTHSPISSLPMRMKV